MDEDVQIGLVRGQIGLDVLCVLGFVVLAVVVSVAVVVVILLRRNRKE